MDDRERRIRILRLKQAQANAQGGALQPAPQVQAEPEQEEQPGLLQRIGQGFNNAASAMFNDINAGFQQVNPVGMEETRGQAVGTLRSIGDKQYVDVDGVLEPLDRYPSDRFATHLDRESGLTLVIPRQGKTQDGAPYDNNDPRIASAGRLAGYGAVLQTGKEVVRAGNEVAKAARDIDVVPSYAMRGPAQARIASAGQQFFPTAGAFGGDAARVADELGQAGQRIAQNAGPGASANEAGSALKSGVEVFKSNFKDVSGKLYQAVDARIPPNTRVQSPNTVAALKAMVEPFENTPNLAREVGVTRLQGWIDDLSGEIPWTTARQLRSEIGSAIGKINGPLADQSQGRLKAAYQALSADLDDAARAAGPEALQAWTRANNYNRAGRARIDGALDKIFKADSPEKAFANFEAMTRKGTAQSNIFKVKKTIQSLPKEERAVVAGTIIRQMGEATPGAQSAAGDAFSPSAFLTRWNKMDPEARDVIAGAGMDPGVKQQLNQLARVVEKAKAAKAFENHSNSGGVFANGMLFFLAGGDMTGSVAAGAGLGHLSAKFLTSRKALEALNETAATGRLTKLQALANDSGEISKEAGTMIRLLMQTSAQPSP